MDSKEPQETPRVFSVCLPESRHQFEYSVAKFSSVHNLEFTNCPGGAKMERENNLKEFRSAYDIDALPKSGAGSEYGREQREEARRKKYGIRTKNYNPNDQPWTLKMGAGKHQKRFKGTKSGGVSRNANYTGFVLAGSSKLIALPLNEWYDFMPQARYKALNEDEAEEEFSRRDKTFNHFAIMAKKKYNLETAKDDEQEKEGKSKSGRKGKLLVSEFELMSGSDDDDSEKEEREVEGNEKKDKKKDKKKKTKTEEDSGEAVEDKDGVDEGEEMDYISASSSDEDMFDEGRREDKEIYNDGGVAEEEALISDDEEEEEEEKKDEDEADKTKTKDSDSESASDSDIESNSLFDMPTQKSGPSNKLPSGQEEVKIEATIDRKIKSESPEVGKKVKIEPSEAPKRSDNSMEEIVKRCLLRKPATATDLLKKLTSKQTSQNVMAKKQIYDNLVLILQKLKPASKNMNGAMYFSLPNNKN